MTVLLTGGAGYLGSHCCVAFLAAGHDVVVLDNLSNSRTESLQRVGEISGRKIAFEKADVREQAAVEKILRHYGCDSVVHFAGSKVPRESIDRPLEYYDNNVVGTHRLLSAMAATGVHRLIFSSTAAVYGQPQFFPVTEDHPVSPGHPYGRTKLMVEDMLRDVAASDDRWRFGILRYFNPVGAHPSGLIGEDPLGVPANLMPFIAQVASGRRERLQVFGNDYDTPDGTGVRDYIHVMDLVEGHLHAHDALEGASADNRCFTVNLGTGTGYSVLQMIHAFERASNRTIPFMIAPRRDGDVGECYAGIEKAADVIHWRARRDLEAMCHDTWNWVCKNPRGYEAA